MFDIKKQLSKLYCSSVLGSLSLAGAWVAILAARGFSLVEISAAETVYHVVKIISEVPSGALADVFGRKKMLVISCILQMMGDIAMILSDNIFMVCLSCGLYALRDSFSSGTGDALAYDSLKLAGLESRFERYESNQLVIFRVCGGISNLCAGLALIIGYRAAYGTGLITGAVQLAVLLTLRETAVYKLRSPEKFFTKMKECFRESFLFLKREKKAVGIMFGNSLIGAPDTLLLFFLQAKLIEKGIPEFFLGPALLFVELGGIIGSRLILRFPRLDLKKTFAVTAVMIIAGLLAEHSPLALVAALGGFLSAMGDDALQVRTNAALQDMFPSEQRATLTSVDSFTFSIVMIALTPMAGEFFTYW